MSEAASDGLVADIVLEGGGVKGIALVGAISVLAERGYRFERVAGTSAGAIVGSLIAADIKPAELLELMQKIDYSAFKDANFLDRLGPPGQLASLLLGKGIYEGKYVRNWVSDQLAAHGVERFKDLRRKDVASSLPPEQDFRLVVMASDVSQGCLRRLPWDCQTLYGCDADEVVVADAVRASMSIPFFYRPAVARNATSKETSWLVDGGMLSNFPVTVFDRHDNQPPRWPTFGIKLSAQAGDLQGEKFKVKGSLSLAARAPRHDDRLVPTRSTSMIPTCSLARSSLTPSVSKRPTSISIETRRPSCTTTAVRRQSASSTATRTTRVGTSRSTRSGSVRADQQPINRRTRSGGDAMSYELQGHFLEACDCNTVCPCWIDDEPDEAESRRLRVGHRSWSHRRTRRVGYASRPACRFTNASGRRRISGSSSSSTARAAGSTSRTRSARCSSVSGAGPWVNSGASCPASATMRRSAIDIRYDGGSSTVKVGDAVETDMQPVIERRSSRPITHRQQHDGQGVRQPAQVGRSRRFRVTSRSTEFDMERAAGGARSAGIFALPRLNVVTVATSNLSSTGSGAARLPFSPPCSASTAAAWLLVWAQTREATGASPTSTGLAHRSRPVAAGRRLADDGGGDDAPVGAVVSRDDRPLGAVAVRTRGCWSPRARSGSSSHGS